MITRALAAGAAVLLLAAGSAGALTPAEKCESSKLKEAGKYGFCRLKAESKAVKTASTPDYSKCDAKYGTKWPGIESGGGGQCPSNGDQTAIQAFITQHTDDLAAALAGGPLPDCSGDLATCNGNLSTCNGDLGTAQASLITCTGDLDTCNTDLLVASDDLSTCNGDLATASADLTTCTSDLSTASADLAGCTGSLSTCNGSLTSCTTALGTCPGDLATCQATPQGQIRRTGQTTCYDAAGTVIACAGTGQDGELQKGLTLSYTDNGDGTITDNRTGLVWEKLSDDGSIHDWDNTYTWTDAFSIKIASLNSSMFAGHSDWRLPNRFELESAADLRSADPAVDPVFNTGCAPGCTVLTCSCTQQNVYWPSNSYKNIPSQAWVVNFGDGGVGIRSKTNTFNVRAVRGGA